MWDYIAGLKGDTTIVLTTHYLEEADALADRLAVIDGGELIAVGTPADLKGSIGGAPVMVVEAPNLNADALAALTEIHPTVKPFDGGVEIEAGDVSVYEIGDHRRFGSRDPRVQAQNARVEVGAMVAASVLIAARRLPWATLIARRCRR